jgi:hypothetical protein
VYQDQRILRLTNFRRLKGFGTRLRRRSLRQDKGQEGCVRAFVEAVRTGGGDPIPFEEIHEVSRVAIELAEIGSRRPG